VHPFSGILEINIHMPVHFFNADIYVSGTVHGIYGIFTDILDNPFEKLLVERNNDLPVGRNQYIELNTL